MTNDAKLGLILGLGLLIAVAIFFFRKDVAAKADQSPATALAKRQ